MQVLKYSCLQRGAEGWLNSLEIVHQMSISQVLMNHLVNDLVCLVYSIWSAELEKCIEEIWFSLIWMREIGIPFRCRYSGWFLTSKRAVEVLVDHTGFVQGSIQASSFFLIVIRLGGASLYVRLGSHYTTIFFSTQKR